MSGLGFGIPSGWGGSRFPTLLMIFFLCTLLATGTLFVHSATSAGEAFPGASAKSHLVKICFGFSFLVLFLLVPYRKLIHWSLPLYLFGLSLLGYLLLIKFSGGGVERWIRLGNIFSLQPSELIKVFAVLLTARVLMPVGRYPTSFDYALPFAAMGIPFMMVAMQPDLGTALVIPPGLLAMLWASGIRLRRFITYICMGLSILPFAWMLLRDYQRQRLMVFLDPEDPAVWEASYQVRQSMIAIGSGGLEGKGLYQGTQNTLGYLPEDHNDFIFAIIGEEWGLLGTLGLLGLFLLLYISCFAIAWRTREPYGRLVAVGLTTQMAFQTFVNMAMTLGIAPVTGLPLPFISFGGSALLGSLMSIGIIMGIGMRPVRVMTTDGLSHGSSVNMR